MPDSPSIIPDNTHRDGQLSSEEYRRKEKLAEALAEATQDQVVKETYLEVAERWRQLAAWAERNNR